MDLSGKGFRQDEWELDFGLNAYTRQHRERLPDRLGAPGRLCVGHTVFGLSSSLATVFIVGLSSAVIVAIPRSLGCCSPSSGPLRQLSPKVTPL